MSILHNATVLIQLARAVERAPGQTTIKDGSLYMSFRDDGLLVQVQGINVFSGGVFLWDDKLEEEIDTHLKAMIAVYRKKIYERVGYDFEKPLLETEEIIPLVDITPERLLIMKMTNPTFEPQDGWKLAEIRSEVGGRFTIPEFSVEGLSYGVISISAMLFVTDNAADTGWRTTTDTVYDRKYNTIEPRRVFVRGWI